jgi:Ca-activated chloride channel family protein
MKFGNIEAVHYMWLLIAFLIFLVWTTKKRRRDMLNFADAGLISSLTKNYYKQGERIKQVLISVAVLLLILSLMRPQWGFEWNEVKRSGLDILIAMDTSNSMLAEDVKPNRLERSKLAVKDLVKRLQGDRIGLIAFAGNAFLQCPLTVDYNGFMLSLDSMDVNTIPKGGTSISSAIRTALDSYEGGMKKYKVMVIITDGEDHEGKALETAQIAKEKGIKIFTIGIGTPEGELIPVTDDTGKKVFLKNREGNVVKTALDEGTLKEIALSTGGSYVKSTNTEFGLDLIYEEKLSKMEKREIESKMVKSYEERFQTPLVLALILLCIEPFIRRRKQAI